MNKSLMKTLGVVVAIGGLALAWPAQAVLVTVDGAAAQNYPGPVAPPATAPHVLDGLGYPGDSVGLQGRSFDLGLAVGTSVHKINTLNWTVSYTYAGDGDPVTPDDPWYQLQFTINASRDVTIGSQTVTLNQTGLLEVNWDNDYLSFSAGPTATLYVGAYQVDVTPLGVARTGASLFPGFPGGTPWVQPDIDMMARFDISMVPEPTTMVAGALLLLPFGLSTLRMLRKRHAA